MRTIKFRIWYKEIKSYLAYYPQKGMYATPDLSYFTLQYCIYHPEMFDVEQFTGLTDKNGVEIYPNDLLRIKGKMGDGGQWRFDSIFRVNELTYEGLELSFIKQMDDNPRNQVPICQYPSFKYRSLTTDGRNNNPQNLAIPDTTGENTVHHRRWQEHHYTNDIEVIGNIHENPELLK